MSPQLETGTSTARALSVAIFSPDGLSGVEVLTLGGYEGDVLTAADSLGVDLSEDHDASASVIDLHRVVQTLFATSAHDLHVDDVFVDTVTFTRQIPLEQSPVENWSLAEIWARLSGPAAGFGIGFAAHPTIPVLILSGTFGTLLMRPLTAVVEAVAEGVRDPVREATERYTRAWLRLPEASSEDQPKPDRPEVERAPGALVESAPHADPWKRREIERETGALASSVRHDIRELRDLFATAELDAGRASDAARLLGVVEAAVDALPRPVIRDNHIHYIAGDDSWLRMPMELRTLERALLEMEALELLSPKFREALRDRVETLEILRRRWLANRQ